MNRSLLAVALLLATAGTSAAAVKADYVLTDGKVYTVNAKQPWAQAIAVKGNRIVYVGDNEGARKYVGKGSRTVDLGGRLVLPGLIESHIHLLVGAVTTSGAHVGMDDTPETVVRKVADYAKANPDRKVIFGSAYNALIFDGNGPNKAALDAVIPDRPVFLFDHTIHSAWVNSKTLQIAGITRDARDPPGGKYVRDAAGEPTGWIVGTPASIPMLERVKAVTEEGVLAVLPNLVKGLNEFGFTAIMDYGNAAAADASFRALTRLDRKGELSLRVELTHLVNTPALAATAVEVQRRYARQYKSKNVALRMLKVIDDSVLENEKAAMMKPYVTGSHAPPYFTPAQLLDLYRGAPRAGQGVTVHALGDQAVRDALDAAEAIRKSGDRKSRIVVTHAQFIQPQDRPRFGQLDVLLQTTGNWANVQPTYHRLIDKERDETLQFPFRTVVDTGGTIAFGADWPATPGGFVYGVNPYINIYTAMHRMVPDDLVADFGSANRVLEPAREVLTLEEAIRAYTINGAKAVGREKEIGSIEVGKKADLVMLDRNLFEVPHAAIPKTKVLATMFDGKLVYDAVYRIGSDRTVDMSKLDEGATGGCMHDPKHAAPGPLPH